MANETPITIIGNLTADPELRFTPGGDAVANFTVASTPRKFDRNNNEWKDGDPLFLNCSVWKQYAEHVSESLQKGSRVVVQGTLKQRSYETKEGEKRTVFEVEVEEVGPSLRYATAKLTRTTQGGGGGAQKPQVAAGGPRGAAADPWGKSGGADPWAQTSTSEAPF